MKKQFILLEIAVLFFCFIFFPLITKADDVSSYFTADNSFYYQYIPSSSFGGSNGATSCSNPVGQIGYKLVLSQPEILSINTDLYSGGGGYHTCPPDDYEVYVDGSPIGGTSNDFPCSSFLPDRTLSAGTHYITIENFGCYEGSVTTPGGVYIGGTLTPSHYACQGLQCVSVPTVGTETNSCTTDPNSCNPHHYACQNAGQGLQCTQVSGSEPDSCGLYPTDSCLPHHNVCQNLRCTTLPIAGVDSCGTNPDTCYHYACVNQTCGEVPGLAVNSCGNDSDCYHSLCQNQTCVRVDGGGNSECSINEDCMLPINTCGGLAYNPALGLQCCGDPNNPNALIFNPNTQKCCVDTSNPGNPIVKLYDPAKGEQCCYADPAHPATSSGKVCNGCQACVTANKTYTKLFEPTYWNGTYEGLHCAGTQTVTTGQCIDDCKGCTRCTDNPATGGKFCKSTEQKMAEQVYAAHPTYTHPRPVNGQTQAVADSKLFLCDCGGDVRPGFGIANQGFQHSCFQYGNLLIGPEPVTGCPANSNLDTKELGSCKCKGPGTCTTPTVTSSGTIRDICSNRPCNQVPGYTAAAGNNSQAFYYDCPNGGVAYCCAPASAEQGTSYCVGTGVCGPGGTGNPCQRNSDCSFPNNGGGNNGNGNGNGGNGNGGNGGGGAGQCNSDHQCVAGGGGAACTSNTDCQNLTSYCNSNNQCTANGSGGACTADADCAGKTCTSDSQCIVGGGGVACITTCNFTCNANRQCVAGGGGAACTSNASCQGLPSQCDSSHQCVPGGGGVACTGLADCNVPASRCNNNHQCVVGGAGILCAANTDCNTTLSPYQCDSQKQCSLNGGGSSCAFPADCQGAGTPMGCDEQQQCVPGGRGVSCVDWTDCQGLHCTADKQCERGGTGGSCTSRADCQNLPPTAVNLRVTNLDYCFGSWASFRWDYTDMENDSQISWQMQVSTQHDANDINDAAFVSHIVYDSGIQQGSTNASTRPVVQGTLTGSISYGVDYYWRVKVCEAGQCSDYAYSTYTYPYAHPSPSFSYTANVSANKTATFTDGSTCYSAIGGSYSCGALPANAYTWWFDVAGNPSSADTSDRASASHTYAKSGTYQTQLQICDDIGCCSSGIKSLMVGNSIVPQWWEISPY